MFAPTKNILEDNNIYKLYFKEGFFYGDYRDFRL